MRRRRKVRRAALALSLALAACAPTATAPPTPVPSPTSSAASPLATTATPSRTPRDAEVIPALQPDGVFANMRVTVEGDEPPGQPWETVALAVKRPTVDAAYRARVASAFGMGGEGSVGAAPDGTAAWRIWSDGDRLLALNDVTGDVLFFDPLAVRAAPAMSAATLGPSALLAALGSTAALSGPGVRSFAGDVMAAGAEHIVDGSWLMTDSGTTTAIFPQFRDRTSPENTTILYSRDELFVYTSGGALAQVVHRPLVGVTITTVRDINTTLPLPEAIRLLKKDPVHYLRLLSITPTNEPMTLRLDLTASGSGEGHAWAGGPQGDLTHLSDMLVPVYAFVAHGMTASGAPVSAMFTVDAVAPQHLSPPAMTVRNITADLLLREQLTQLGGHQPWRLGPEGVLMDELGKNGCPGTYSLARNDVDSATATVVCPNGARLVMTLRRAFPGYERSIWYVSETRK